MLLHRLGSALLFALVSSVMVASTACDGLLGGIDAEAAGGTPAPDGAPGYCCPARTGGCALSGGYRESGECPKNFDICDNMCEQEIVKDEHGCDKLAYKVPPVTTTFASTGSCSHPAFNGNDRPPPGPEAGAADSWDDWDDAGADAGADASSD